MPIYVAVCGAKISCKQAEGQIGDNTVKGTTDEEATGCNGSILTENDFVKDENLFNFNAVCKLNQHKITGKKLPCSMTPIGGWKWTLNGFGDTGEKILKSNSKFNCLYGGTVRITDPNQNQITTSIVRAHEDAIEMLEGKIDDLENNWDDPTVKAEFERFFGPERNRDWGWLPFKEDRFDRHDIIEHLKNMKVELEQMDEDNFLPVDDNGVASVTLNDPDRIINIRGKFKDRPVTNSDAHSDANPKNDSQAGTLVHEVAHFLTGEPDHEHKDCSGGGDDRCYGVTESEALAKADPEKARNNAENIQNFVQS